MINGTSLCFLARFTAATKLHHVVGTSICNEHGNQSPIREDHRSLVSAVDLTGSNADDVFTLTTWCGRPTYSDYQGRF